MLALLGAACTADWDPAPVFDPVLGELAAGTLTPAEDCDQVAASARASLELAVDSWWSGGGDEMADASNAAGAAEFDDAAPMTTAAAAPPAAAADDAESAERQVIGTNTQEVDVDEADIVKAETML